MEAIPRLPMLSFDLKRSPEYVEFGPVLKQYIKTHYGEDPALYNKPCSDLEQLRQETTQVVCDYLGCTTLKKYYAQLQFLQGRFPMKEGEEAAIPFTWEDVQTGRDHVGDIKFEQACILYNIGSLHSLLGVLDTRQNAEGMKVSCTHFQCAAWAFEYLRDNFGSSSMSTDMSFELLSFHILLMLAQGQECILEKSMLDGRKNNITAKVAVQVVEFYRQAISSIDTCDTKHQINSRMHKEWRKRMMVKMTLYQCITYYYQGRQSEEGEKHGECLAFFTAAKDKLAEATKLAKNEVAEITECLKYCQDVVLGKYESAKKDNDFVYHDKVPALDSLPEVKGASLVKGIPFNPNEKEICGPDIFQKLVPMEAHEASSVYSEEKAKLLRSVKGNMEQKDMELDQFMSSLQVDMEQLMPKVDTMPEHLMEKCAAMSVRTNAIQELTDSMAEVSGFATEVELGINEIHELIDTDTTRTGQFEEQYGRKKPSKVLPGMLTELTGYKERHLEGSQLNTTLHKAMNKLTNNLKTLILPPSEILAQLPPSQPQLAPEEDAIVGDLRRLLQKVSEMRDQRKDFLDKLTEQLHKDDITNALVTQDASDKDQLYAEQLKKHDTLVQHINMNLGAQEKILRSLTDANAKFAMMRQTFGKAASKREKTVQELILSYEKYEDLLAKCAKGSDYYKKLFDNVSKTLERCRSECKVRQEERDMLIAQFAPKVSAPSRPSAPKPGAGSANVSMTPTIPHTGGLDPSSMMPADVTYPSGVQTANPDVLSTFSANLPAAFEGPKLKDYLPFMKPRSFGPKPQSPQAHASDPSAHPLSPNIPSESPQSINPKIPDLNSSLASVLPASIAQYIASSVAPAMAIPKSNNQPIPNQVGRDPQTSSAVNPPFPHSSPSRHPLPPESPLPYYTGSQPLSDVNSYSTNTGIQSAGYNHSNLSAGMTPVPHQQPAQSAGSLYTQNIHPSSVAGSMNQHGYPRMPHPTNTRMPHPASASSPGPHIPSSMAGPGYTPTPAASTGFPASQIPGHRGQHVPQHHYPHGSYGARPDITNTVSASNKPVLSSGKDITSATTPVPQQQQQHHLPTQQQQPYGAYQQPVPHQYRHPQQQQQPPLPQQQQQQPPSQPHYQHPYHNTNYPAPGQTQPPPQQQQHPQMPNQTHTSSASVPTSAHNQTVVDQGSNPRYQNYPYPGSSGQTMPGYNQFGQRMPTPNQAQAPTSTSALPPQNVPTSTINSHSSQQQQMGLQQQRHIQPNQNYQQQQQPIQASQQAGHFQPPSQYHSLPQHPMTTGYTWNAQKQPQSQTPQPSYGSQYPGQIVTSNSQHLPGQNVARPQQYPSQIAPVNQAYPGQNVTGQQNVISQQYPGQSVPNQQFPGQTASGVYPGQQVTSGMTYSPHGSPAKLKPEFANAGSSMPPNMTPGVKAAPGQTTALHQPGHQLQQPPSAQPGGPVPQQYQQQHTQQQQQQQQMPQAQHHSYLQQNQQNQQAPGLNQPRPQMKPMVPGTQGQVRGEGQGYPNNSQPVAVSAASNNIPNQGGLNINTSAHIQGTRPPQQVPTPAGSAVLTSQGTNLPPTQGSVYGGYQPQPNQQLPHQPVGMSALQPTPPTGYQHTPQAIPQHPAPSSTPSTLPTNLQAYPNQQVFPPQQPYQAFYPQPGQPASQPQAPVPAVTGSGVQPGMYAAGSMQQPLLPQQLSKSVPAPAVASIPPQPGLAPTTVPPLPSPSSPAPPPLQVITTTSPANSSTPPMSISRQSSSLDDILSSSPNGVTNSSLPITPQVLTDQERQLEKEQAKKNLSQPPETSEPYGSQAALHKLLSDTEAFGLMVDGLTQSILGVSRLDSIWKSLMDNQESSSKKQSMAIARCYPMKNRDPDIMPYDETRVVLTSTKDDYINASWLNDLAPSCPKFISTQSPLPQTCVDFWSMVYEQGTEVLVQITSEYETGKLFPVYYPTEREKPVEQGPLIISLQSVKFRQNWVERIVYLKSNVTKQGRTVVHLQFKGWPVSGFPDDVASIVRFISEVHNFYKQQRSLTKPIIVHCGTGVGRSGVLVMVYAAIQELVHGNGLVDIPGLSKKLRHKRKDILLKKEQLHCTYQCLLCFAEDFLSKRGVLVKTPHFSSTTNSSSSSSSSSSSTVSKDGGGSSREGSNPPSGHPMDDIVFGNVDIETIQANIGLLHVHSDKDKKHTPAPSTTTSKNDVSPNMASLPDVVQQYKGDDWTAGHSRQGSNSGLGGGGDHTGSQIPSADVPQQHQKQCGENGHFDTNVLNSSGPTSATSGEKEETKSSLAQLQDPSTFTLGSPEKQRPRITKANFSKEEGRLANLAVDPSSTDDPLASLDPLWSLGK